METPSAQPFLSKVDLVKADVLGIGDLFLDERGFAAPFHQRPYRWSLLKNWGPFWSCWTAATDAADTGRRLNFLGAVVCRADDAPSTRDGPDDAARTLEVLDGQQRLLTAMVAIHALRLHAARLDDGPLEARLQAVLFDAAGRPRFVAGRASYADQMAALRTASMGPWGDEASAKDAGAVATARMAESARAAESNADAINAAPAVAQGQSEGEGAFDLDDDDDDDPFAALDRGERSEPSDEAAEAWESDGEPSDPEAEWRWDDETGAGAGRLRAALRCFFQLVERELEAARRAAGPPTADAAERAALHALAEALLVRSQVVLITLDGDVSPFDVFERLNHLGEPLSALDLVKNQLFRAAERGGADRPALEALYRRTWRIFDDARRTRFWGATARRGREKRPTQDWFLRAYLSVRDSRNVSMNEALARMDEIARASTEAAPAEIEALCAGARAFAEISGHLDAGPHQVRVDALRRFGRFSVEPALIAMRMHLWDDQQATRELLAVLESVAVRRFFTGLGSGKDYDVYARLTRVIGPGAAENGKRCVREVVRRLKAAQGGAFWPRDAAFKKAFATRKLANRNSNQQARERKAAFRAVFAAIDAAARGADPSAPTPWRQDGRTVEHLFPLNGREHWPELSKAEADLLETIGNLTLVDDALNKEMGQAPWAEKRAVIARDQEIALNAALLEDGRWRREWGPQQIKERGRALAALAVARWPRPR